MKKVFEAIVIFLVLLALILGTMQLVIHLFPGHTGAGIALALVFGFIAISKIGVNFGFGARLGSLDELTFMRAVTCINSNMIVVYIVSLLAGVDPMVGALLRDFTIPSFLSYVIIYAPILIGFGYARRKKTLLLEPEAVNVALPEISWKLYLVCLAMTCTSYFLYSSEPSAKLAFAFGTMLVISVGNTFLIFKKKILKRS
ncbi:hypothetical protein ACET6J_17315 [Aeromonas veronii]|uniref:hypothetical protein n=1 Tax=Aeromonas veronii TaxID=654 RepID=UPI0038DBEA4B